jgi:uncharacterized YigZ family protein
LEKSYRTVEHLAAAELVVKKSKFLGNIAPVHSPEAALAFLAEQKKRYWNASHHVWAYVLRDGQRRYADDGEPQGTAGLPVLEVLQKQGLENCAVVVTRYFGGTLLGAAGLVRAYAGACKAAIDAAQLVTMAPGKVLRIVCDYSFYGKLQRMIEHSGTILSTEFGEQITVKLQMETAAAEKLLGDCAAALGGCAAAFGGCAAAFGGCAAAFGGCAAAFGGCAAVADTFVKKC